MTDTIFDKPLCKHKGWKGRYNLIYNTINKIAKCSICGKDYKYKEAENVWTNKYYGGK